jgi:hypothetical protein
VTVETRDISEEGLPKTDHVDATGDVLNPFPPFGVEMEGDPIRALLERRLNTSAHMVEGLSFSENIFSTLKAYHNSSRGGREQGHVRGEALPRP